MNMPVESDWTLLVERRSQYNKAHTSLMSVVKEPLKAKAGQTMLRSRPQDMQYLWF